MTIRETHNPPLTPAASDRPKSGTLTAQAAELSQPSVPETREPVEHPLRLSAIIPTKNRPKDLRRTVMTLLNQTELPDELIVIDQSGTEQSRQAVAELLASSAPRIPDMAWLSYVRDSEISGVTEARNRGLDLATGNIWLFLDDDVELDPGFVQEILAAYRQYPRATGISGTITNYRPPPLLTRLWTAIFVRGPFHDDRQRIYLWSDRLAKSGPIPVTRLGGGLMSFRAAAVHGVRFDERLTGVSDGEDVDFCMQLGPDAELFIAPRARLAHKQSQTGRARDHWLRRFSQTQSYLHRRHWSEGILKGFCFAWLNAGFAVAATFASIRRRSLVPWQAAIAGSRVGRGICDRALESASELSS